MKAPARPANESSRLEALSRYDLLDTLPEQELDDLTSLASHICSAPISLLSLVDAERQWFKSSVGVEFRETPRDISFCGHAVLGHDLFVVPDAAADDRFAGNPLVTGDLHVRFYAGAPLTTPDGHVLGALCVMDRVPRQLDARQAASLRALSRQVMAQLELRRHTRDLAASEDRLLRVFRGAPTALVIHRMSDRAIVDINPAFTELLGFSRQEAIGQTTDELALIDEPDLTRYRSRLRDQGFLRNEELSMRAVDGRVRHVLMSTEVVDLQHVPHAISTIVDVTPRREADAALRERDEQLRLFVEHSPVAVAMFDRDMRYIVASRRWMEDYHLEDAVIGRGHYEVFPNLPQRWKEVHQRCLAGSVEKCDEDPFTLADGHVTWGRWEVRPWRQADGTIGGLIIFSEDVSGRRNSMAALASAEERMRFALESADVGVWDIDYTTGALRWSPILEAQYGYEPGTFPGTFDAFVACLHPHDRAAVVAAIGRAVERGEDFAVQHRIVRPDGSVRWLNGFGRIQHDAAGTPVRGIGISLDVTERRTLEAQYQQAQKMEAVGRLAGGVAHDFNNMLSAILGYCELLLGGLAEDDPMRSDLLEIQKAGTSAARLTKQLLAFSRKQIIEPRPIDLNEVIAELRTMLGRVIGEDITVVISAQAKPSIVVADRGQIEQVLMNLAVNARDAMPTGGQLTIETFDVELDANYAQRHFAVTPGPYVALTVSDTGMGMPVAVQDHLFEPFFTTKEIGKGTGLGLATVHGIVARSGGSISVYSEVGRGTTFKIYLPRATAADAVMEDGVAASSPAGVRTHAVLVVEDEDGLRALTLRLLSRLGYTAHGASTPEEAVRLLEEHSEIDLLLSDVVMPGISGPELAKTLSARRPGLQVLYMSGYTEEAIVQHGVLKPGIAFLHKPFTVETLSRKLRDVFRD
jgi:PAS domain S-box-containing protein